MGFTASGTTGTLRIGGRQAAGLGQWSLRAAEPAPGEPEGYVLIAPLTETDPYWLDTGGPFELRLTLSRSVWRWRNVAPTLDATTLTARLTSPPEEC